MRALAIILAISIAASAEAEDEPASDRWLFHAELDPFPFATGGYGGQLGVRPPALHGVRFAVASFSIDIPDVVAELGGNAGFSVRVRPSFALYVLDYLAAPGRDGFAFGGALRVLRYEYGHADEAGRARVTELSPELIAGYQWHPFARGVARGFYLQPWLGLSVTAVREGERTIGTHTYDPLPIQPFFTVNLGWELAP